MKISFETWNQNSNLEKGASVQNAASHTQGANMSAYIKDFYGTNMDSNVYGEHTKSLKDVMQGMENELNNIGANRDMMTVLSNIVSTEDFGKMMKDGFDPSKLEPDQIVTIVDHIKAQMAKAGHVVKGYNDDLSQEKLTEILGNTNLAKDVKQALQKADMPVNEENVTAIKETLDKAKDILPPNDASKKYMIENHLTPTIENIYRASFIAKGDGTRQAKGYFSQEMPGYYAKKADNIDWKAMEGQIEKAIDKMNLPTEQTKEESIEFAKWLIEKGIPVTEQSMRQLGDILSVSFPLEQKVVIDACVNALAKGQLVESGNLTDTQETIYEKANRYEEEAKSITKEAVMEVVSREKEVNLKNLHQAQKQLETGEVGAERLAELTAMTHQEIEISVKYVHAARNLAEVQLRMTIDANIRLLKSDFAIDTAPLADLVEELKKQEDHLKISFFGKENSGEIIDKQQIYNNTADVLKEIPFLPAAVVRKISIASHATLEMVHTEGLAMRAQYKAAGISYEALMTVPRQDLGDNIKKAFENVDTILQDMGQELSEDNRKAVRILGYNNTPITKEALEEVRDAYLQVENVIKSMTPQRTLALIRDGINPLRTSLDDLEAYLNQIEQTEEVTKYSRYLYELEKNGQITESERGAYIGIYRLFHQIEKSEGAAIGSLMAQGADITLGNLLTAVRNKKAGGMDYTIDDNFGLLSDTVVKGNSITAQIESGVAQARLTRAIYRDLSVEKLQSMDVTEQTTLSELRDGLAEYEVPFIQDSNVTEYVMQTGMMDMQPANQLHKEIVSEAMLQEEKADWELASTVEKEILEALDKQGIQLTVDNILAAKNITSNRGSFPRQIKEYAKKLDGANGSEDVSEELKQAESSIIENFTDFEAAQKAMENWENQAQFVLQETMSEITQSTEEMKILSMCYKQMSLTSQLRRQENYEVPMEINGEMTSVNLILVHDADEKGTVSITMQTESFGKAGVKFQITGNMVESYFVADSEMGINRLEAAGKQIMSVLEEKGMQIGQTRYVNANSYGRKDGNFLTFFGSGVDNNNDMVATTKLYDTAKTFLSIMQKTIR